MLSYFYRISIIKMRLWNRSLYTWRWCVYWNSAPHPRPLPQWPSPDLPCPLSQPPGPTMPHIPDLHPDDLDPWPTLSSFSASRSLTRSIRACSARATFAGEPFTRMTSLPWSGDGTLMLTSWSSIICRTSRPRWPIMKRWRSRGTMTSLVMGTRACKQHINRTLLKHHLLRVVLNNRWSPLRGNGHHSLKAWFIGNVFINTSLLMTTKPLPEPVMAKFF